MTVSTTKTFIAIALFVAAIASTRASAQQASKAVKAVQLMGLPDVKENAKGILSVETGNLHFVHGKAASDISVRLIEDVVTGGDSQKSVGKTVGAISMAAPYGGGRFLSLFRSKIDTLTVEYRDAKGALHGAIFTMAIGTAEVIKEELIAQGAHTMAPAEQGASGHSSSSTAHDKEQKQ